MINDIVVNSIHQDKDVISVVVVLVNYNTTDVTMACVGSIMDSDQRSVTLRIIVVDNSDRFPLPELEGIIVIRPGQNIGLSPAWFLAYKEMREAPANFVIFMNNDVKIARSFFTELVSGFERWGDDCMFGGRIYRMDQPDVIWSRGGAVDADRVVIRHDDCDVHKSTVKDGDFETGHISGCCMAIPYALLEKIGGPDPDFFFRGEEWDLNYRVQLAGARLVILDRMVLWHAVNASHNRFAPDMLYLAYRAKVLFARKHQSIWRFPIWYIAGFIYAILIGPVKFARLSKQKTWPIRKALLLAFKDGLRCKKIHPRPELREIK